MWAWGRRKVQTEAAEENSPAPSVVTPVVIPLEASIEAPATESSPQDSKGPQLSPEEMERLLSECRDRIREQISFAKNLSEKEIMTIGEIVQNIVNHTRQYIEESKHAVVDNFAEQSLSLSEYLDSTRQATDMQNNTVREALTLSDDITKAGLAVDKLANQARLLALNAKIEAARLGSAGSAFSVITEEMNHLSMEIAKTNRLIADSTQAIRVCLPTLAEQATMQIKRLEEFSQTMQGLKESIEESISTTNNTSDSHIDQVLNLAYETLSHLQFQDPMIQSVQKIDSMVRRLHNEMNRAMGITVASDAKNASSVETMGTKFAKSSNDDAGDAPDAGEVMLF